MGRIQASIVARLRPTKLAIRHSCRQRAKASCSYTLLRHIRWRSPSPSNVPPVLSLDSLPVSGKRCAYECVFKTWVRGGTPRDFLTAIYVCQLSTSRSAAQWPTSALLTSHCATTRNHPVMTRWIFRKVEHRFSTRERNDMSKLEYKRVCVFKNRLPIRASSQQVDKPSNARTGKADPH